MRDRVQLVAAIAFQIVYAFVDIAAIPLTIINCPASL